MRITRPEDNKEEAEVGISTGEVSSSLGKVVPSLEEFIEPRIPGRLTNPEGEVPNEIPEIGGVQNEIPEPGSPTTIQDFSWTPETIREALDSDQIDESTAVDLYVQHNLQTDFFGMSSEEVEHAYLSGWIDDDQAENYLTRRDNPYWWHTRDLLKGVATGSAKYIENMSAQYGRLENWITGKDKDFSIREGHMPDAPEAMAGQLTGKFTEWGLAFASAGRVFKATGALNLMANAPKMKTLAESSPKVAQFLQAVMVGGAKGAYADYVSFDPFEGRVTDLMNEHGILPEFLDFMTTNEDNPESWERFKNVLEGAFIGSALEGVVLGARVLKSGVYNKYMGDLDALARDINQANELSAAYNQAKALQHTRAVGKASTAKIESPTGEPHHDPVGSLVSPRQVDELLIPGEASPWKKTELERLQRQIDASAPYEQQVRIGQQKQETAERSLKAFVEGKEPVTEAPGILRKIQDLDGDTERLIKIVYESEPPRRVQTHEETIAKSEDILEKLAEATGGNPKAIMNHMRNFKIEASEMTERAHAVYRLYARYSDELMLKARQYTGTEREMVELLEHFKVHQELQGIVNGVRTEFGRGLNMHNIGINKARFDFTDIDLQHGKGITEGMDALRQNKKNIEKMIQKFAEMPDINTAGKLTRSYGNNVADWLLRYRQASLLWSPVTHLVNTTSQVVALTFRTVARGLAHSIEAGRTWDSSYLKSFAKEQLGVAHALKTCFEGVHHIPKHAKKFFKAQDGVTFREAITRDPKIGTAYKALIGAEGIIDPMQKFDMTSPLVRNKALRFGDTFLTIPFHALAGADEVFKTVGSMSEYYGLIYREGIKNGLKGQDLTNYFNRVVKEGRPSYFREALKVGKEITYQDDLGRGFWGKAGQLSNTWPGTVGRIMAAPFFKTLVNLVGWAGKNSPLGVFSKTVREKFMKGGVDQWEVVARIAMGTAAMTWAWNKYDSGEITGRFPKDQRRVLSELGVREYSVYNEKTNSWVNYRRLGDPSAMWIAAVTDLRLALDIYDQYAHDTHDEFDRDVGDVMTALLAAFVEPVVNTTFMRGMQDFSNLMLDPDLPGWDYRAKKMGRDFAGSLIPTNTAIKWFNSEFGADEYYREVNTMIDNVWELVDRESLHPKRDPLYGEKRPLQKRFWHIIPQGEMKDDPVLWEMARVGATVRPVKDRLNFEGQSITITPAQRQHYYDIYESMPIREVLNHVINMPGYQGIGEAQKRSEILTGLIGHMKAASTTIFFDEDPGSYDEILNKALREAEAIVGYKIRRNQAAELYRWLD